MLSPHVALAELQPVWQWEFRLENVEGSDPVTGCVELADDMGANETGRTGDENGEGVWIHARGLASTPDERFKGWRFTFRQFAGN